MKTIAYHTTGVKSRMSHFQSTLTRIRFREQKRTNTIPWNLLPASKANSEGYQVDDIEKSERIQQGCIHYPHPIPLTRDHPKTQPVPFPFISWNPDNPFHSDFCVAASIHLSASSSFNPSGDIGPKEQVAKLTVIKTLIHLCKPNSGDRAISHRGKITIAFPAMWWLKIRKWTGKEISCLAHLFNK